MKASLKWLNKYVDLDGVSVDEIAEALPMLGLEVEGIETTGLKLLDKVVVGEILSREPHPDSDHLVICQLDVGQEEPAPEPEPNPQEPEPEPEPEPGVEYATYDELAEAIREGVNAV